MKEFNLDNIKKEMPYKVPEHFFEDITEKTLLKAKEKKKKTIISKWVLYTASIAASLVLILYIAVFAPANNSSRNFAFDDTLKNIYTDYQSVIEESLLIPNISNADTNNEIDEIISEIPDEELDNIFFYSDSDIYYAQLKF